MITDDEIMRMFELADPAGEDDGARTIDAAGYLDALQPRSYDMTLTELTEAPSKPPRDHRWALAATAAAIVLIVAGALILTRGGSNDAPSAPPTTAVPVSPTTAVGSAESAIALVRSFYDARNAFDADLALSYLADGAKVESWSASAAVPHRIVGPDEFRLETSNAAASNSQALLGDCTTIEGQDPGFTIRCGFDYHDLGSSELGLDPFGDNSTIVVVVDGAITSIAETLPLDLSGFEQQVWDPFWAWIGAQHPDDGVILNGSTTEASVALWEQRSREWVEARLAAEQVATAFLEAFAAFDADAAGAHLADGSSTLRLGNHGVADYQEAIVLYQAMGFEQQLGACRQLGATVAGLVVECPFAYQLLGSGDLGLGPFDGSTFTITVDTASGLISDVSSSWADADFEREVGEPFAAWVQGTHPDDAAVMYVDGRPALTPESLALWDQLRGEYVAFMLGEVPPTTP